MPNLSRRQIVVFCGGHVDRRINYRVCEVARQRGGSCCGEPGPLVQSVVVAGRMANASRVFLGATITGRVREVPFREGALVKAGQVIVQLEDGEPLFVTELPLELGVIVALVATLCGVLAAAAAARSAAKLDPAQAIRI